MLMTMSSVLPVSAAPAPTAVRVTYDGTAINSKRVFKGASIQLGYELTPSTAASSVKWTTSNANVAKISSKGVLTGVNYGVAWITATTANNKSVSIYVKTVARYPQALSLAKTAYTLPKGRSVTVKATTTPAASYVLYPGLTWTSSNPAVATVTSSGKVKGIKAGTAVITATSADGSKKAKCTVTVKNIVSLDSAGADGRQGYYYINGRRYTRYSTRAVGGWYSSWGCITASAAVAASGFGKTVTPVTLHTGSAAYCERAAYNAIGGANLYGSASPSLYAITYMLKKMGISAKLRCNYTDSAAIKEITEWSKAGKPVIMIANDICSCGIKLQSGFHARVLVGMNSAGYGIWIDTSTGLINYARGISNYYKMTVEHYIRYHMQPTSNYKNAYVTSGANAGGYILVG